MRLVIDRRCYDPYVSPVLWRKRHKHPRSGLTFGAMSEPLILTMLRSKQAEIEQHIDGLNARLANARADLLHLTATCACSIRRRPTRTRAQLPRQHASLEAIRAVSPVQGGPGGIRRAAEHPGTGASRHRGRGLGL